ncbi:MAG: AmmeMemoRadiSam system protein B [Proteobacteria bacterium]|nr:AmmeMemoRadiSam system protein B [Desulfobulbaceae bacterium]MBU4153428.1 AmmeMemoRadiSam system protein B [Pseudomonadota bacterium]
MLTYKSLAFLLPLLVLAVISHAQKRPEDRQPAVAGMFYPGRADELKQMLTTLFTKAIARKNLGHISAIIVPHAGYEYSGLVAASGFNQLDPDASYNTIFILGPSHRIGFEGAAVYCTGNFTTPLGTVVVNRELGEELVEKSKLFTTRTDAHAVEHSVEVQVPFLQQHLKKPFRIVPIVLGHNSPETCRAIGEALLPYMNDHNLFVISTDFSHYPDYNDAVAVDKSVANAIVSNSPDTLITTMRGHEESNIRNLATTLCGASGVLTLMYMTSASSDFAYHPIQYKNSGDTPDGDKRRVVGYHALTVTKQEKSEMEQTSFVLTPKDKETLLKIARNTVARYVTRQPIPEINPDSLSDILTMPCGAFVTLKNNGQLRGCIGQFDALGPLYSVVQDMAIAAASRDNRFTPVAEDEVKDLTIEISVLTPMKKINSVHELELGKHGIYIRQGLRSGTFLPQVATETGWTKHEFLGHCSRDKAGIGWDGWKDAELYVYEALVFGERHQGP